MLGNDIVDLNTAGKDSNWRRRGYLEKVFTSYEQNLISCSSNPDLLVWILWSIKESVYKAHFRIYQFREFAPKKIEITDIKIKEETAVAEAFYHNKKYYSKTAISDSFVHSIVLNEPLKFSEIKTAIFKTGSRDYTSLLINKNLIDQSDIVEKTQDGIPNIVSREEGVKIPISISHHGDFLGIIIKDLS